MRTLLAIMHSAGCGSSSNVETAASPVEAGTRSQETLRRFGDSFIAKVLAPAPVVWEALLATLAARKVTPSLLDRRAGRMGDTALVMLRRWNGQPVSYYMNCGSSMTGQRADEDRVSAVLLAQMTRLQADTIGVAVHLSATSTSISGASGTPAQCASNGRGEAELLDEVIRRVGGGSQRP